MDVAQILQDFIPLAFVLLVALTVHEFAHAWTAYKLGDPTAERAGRVTLNPFAHLDPLGTIVFFLTQGFGWAKPVPVNPTNFSNPRRDDILVSAAGPISNLILAFFSGLLFFTLQFSRVLPFPDSPEATPLVILLFKILSYMLTVNLILAFFNLIPLFPLDGSHIVKNFLPLNQAYKFSRFNESYGPWILLALLLMGRITSAMGFGWFDPLRWLIWTPVEFFIKVIHKISVFIFNLF